MDSLRRWRTRARLAATFTHKVDPVTRQKTRHVTAWAQGVSSPRGQQEEEQSAKMLLFPHKLLARVLAARNVSVLLLSAVWFALPLGVQDMERDNAFPFFILPMLQLLSELFQRLLWSFVYARSLLRAR